jgi:antitoxin CptB
MDELENDISKLRWHCRRGVKELDVVLSGFLEKHYQNADEASQQAFVSLLKLEDPILMSLVMEQHHSEDEAQRIVLEQMRSLFTLD